MTGPADRHTANGADFAETLVLESAAPSADR